MEILTSRFVKISFPSKEVNKFSKGIYGYLKKRNLFFWSRWPVENSDLTVLLIHPFFFTIYKPRLLKKELKR